MAPTAWLAFLLRIHEPDHAIPMSHSRASTRTTRLTLTNSLYRSLRRKARYLSTAIAVAVISETDAVTNAMAVVGDKSIQYSDGSSIMVANIKLKCNGTTTSPTARSDNAKQLNRAFDGGCMAWLFRNAIKIRAFPIEEDKNTIVSSAMMKTKILFENSCKKE